MKKPSLQSLAVLFTCFNDRIKASKIAFIALLMLCAGYPGFAQVSVSPASGGTNICSNLAFFGSTPTLTAIGTITVTETVSSDLSIGTDQVVLEAPTGWQFNPTGTPILNFTAGRNITAMSLGAVSASSITVNITVSNTTLLDAFTITGIQVIASNTTSSPGYIYALTSSGILGITTGATGTDFANLSLTSSVAPSVSISPSLSGTICAGLNETFTPTPTNGGVSPTYQWFVNGSSVGTGTPYSSSTLSNGNTVNCIMTPTAGGCYSPATATSNTITMSVNPVPTTVTVTGGGTSCGSTTLTASNGGSGTIYYQGTTSGGTSISTPATSEVISTSGTYYFNAESAAGCWGTQGSAVVVINPLPSAVTVTGGGSFCGGTTTLNASNLGDGTIYYEGTTSNGTSVAAPATSEVIAASGTYYFRAESSLGCWGTQGSQVVTINPIPTTVVASGAGTFCGSTVITAANGGSGTIYFQGTTSGGTSTVLGGSPQTVTTSGTYYFNAESGAGCWGTQGSVAVTINTAATANAGLPQSICAGATVTLAGSIGGSATTSTWSAPSGTFSNVNSLTSSYTPTIATGVVTLTLTTNDPDGAGPCSAATSTVNITVNPLPNTPTVSGGGTSCGSATLTSALVGAGTDYFQGTTSGGTSTTLGLSPQIVTSSGTYYFRAQNGGCWGAQGSAVVTINPLPNPYTVTGGGGYCTGGTGSDVGLSYSDAGVNYQLQRGGENVGPVMSGTNAPLDFGLQTVAGTYTVVATNPTTGCTLVMGGSAIVSINALPTQFTVTGGGAYCSGGTGVAVGLSGSITGVTYQLKLGGSPVGSPVSGTTGSVITFGPQTAAGTYTVTATTAATGCTNTMLGNAVVTINPSPTTFSVTGGGTYCTGGLGLAVGLAGSTAGISYQLFYGGLPSGPALTGTGSALTFGMETAAGAYTVVATNTVTLCTSNMTGSAVIAISALPSAYAVTGGGSFCSGGTGVDVGLDGSDVGFSYQLYVGGVATGPAIAGTGGAIDFDMQTTGGTYTVVATNIATLCTANMTGSVVVTVDALPTAFTVTGGGPYCTGGFGLAVGLSGSQVGVSYQLYNLHL